MKITLDASVGIKWFSGKDESNIDIALNIQQQKLQNKMEIVVPDLFFFEILNVLLKKKYFRIDDIFRASESLYLMEMEIIYPDKKIIDKAIDISGGSGLTFYDSLYIAVALNRHTSLITEDHEILRYRSKFRFIRSLDEF